MKQSQSKQISSIGEADLLDVIEQLKKLDDSKLNCDLIRLTQAIIIDGKGKELQDLLKVRFSQYFVKPNETSIKPKMIKIEDFAGVSPAQQEKNRLYQKAVNKAFDNLRKSQ